jgi:tyrosyl-tRNA synthetase
MLEAETIKNNLKNYKKQVGKIIDLKKAEFHPNSSWLKKLGYADVGTHAEIFSINQFISRDNIAKRLKEGKRVSLREVLYPLMQGYDSVAIKADVELGGTDQKFNLLAGRDMQKYFGQTPQNIITGPLIEGLDGRKMSSSWGNTVNFLDEPNDMYGKIMSLKDDFVIKYFELLTRVPMADIESYKKRLVSGENPKNIKIILAKTLVAMYHDEKSADKAAESWESTFSQGEIPKDTKTIKIKIKMPLVDILIKEGIVKSKGDFRRLVEEGAIKFKGTLEERKIVDPNTLADESGALRIGKKRFLKIEIIKN